MPWHARSFETGDDRKSRLHRRVVDALARIGKHRRVRVDDSESFYVYVVAKR